MAPRCAYTITIIEGGDLLDCQTATCALGTTMGNAVPANCKTSDRLCTSRISNSTVDVAMYSCVECASGYKLKSNIKSGTNCPLTYYTCVEEGSTCTTTSSGCSGTAITPTISSCDTITEECFGGYKVQSCSQCSSGSTLTAKTLTVDGCSNTYSYNICEMAAIGGGCDDCESDADWSNASGGMLSNGYEKKTTRTCVLGTCRETTTYRCGAGYYGITNNGTSGCTMCPSAYEVAPIGFASSDADDNSVITKCFATSGNDKTGRFTFTSSCYYSN